MTMEILIKCNGGGGGGLISDMILYLDLINYINKVKYN